MRWASVSRGRAQKIDTRARSVRVRSWGSTIGSKILSTPAEPLTQWFDSAAPMTWHRRHRSACPNPGPRQQAGVTTTAPAAAATAPRCVGPGRAVMAALLGGTSPADALRSAVQSLQSDPAITAAVNTVLAAALGKVLDTLAVQQAAGSAAQDAVVNLLEGSALNNKTVESVAGQVTKGTVESLLGNPAAQKLIGSLAVDIANGMAPSDVTNVVIHSVITSPGLQIAVGMAVGQGIGSLLGDNLVGGVVGGVVGVTATVFVGVASAFAQLFTGLRSLFGLGGSAAAASAASGYTVAELVAGSALPGASGLRDTQDGTAPRHAASVGSSVGAWAWVPVGGAVLEIL